MKKSMNKPHQGALEIPPEVMNDIKGLELARIWAANEKQVVSIRWDFWDDPNIFWSAVVAGQFRSISF